MKVSKLEWPKCPECGVVINSWDHLPASLLMSESRYFQEMNCPKCKKSFDIKANIAVSFDVEKIKV